MVFIAGKVVKMCHHDEWFIVGVFFPLLLQSEVSLYGVFLNVSDKCFYLLSESKC